MPKTKISEFSATPGNNTDIDGINIAEGCAPSGINDAIRELMAQLKDFQAGTAGDSFNGPIGSTTPAAGTFTNLSASGTFALTGDQVQISEGGTGQTTANAAFNALAPSQASNAGKYLKTDGTNTSWDALDISTADITGTLPIANGGTGLTALGTGVQTALGIAVGSAGAFVVNGGALGTPSSGTVTNLTGTASININGTVGATTPTTGAFTTLSASGNITVSGGTANGVAYLNGSKVLTTGSNLTFNGDTLTNNNGTANPSIVLNNTVSGAQTYLNLNSGATVLGALLRPNATNDVRLDANFGSLVFGIGSAGTATEQMRLTSTGLGIGTSSPNNKLEVVSSSGTVASFRNSGAATGQIAVGNTAGDLQLRAVSSGDSLIFSDTGKYLAFGTNGGTERLRITSAGDVGIGTSSPASKLHINTGGNTTAGGITLQNSGNQQHYWYLSTNTTSTFQIGSSGGEWTWVNSNGERARIDSSGNLGVGTTSPSSRFHAAISNPTRGVIAEFQNSLFPATTGAQIAFSAGSVGSWAIGQPAGVSDFAFWSGRGPGADGTERMRLDASGNLGLGVTPSAWAATVYRAIDLSNTASVAGYFNGIETSSSLQLLQNAFEQVDGGGYKYKRTGAGANLLRLRNGIYEWYTAASGTAGNAISFTQAMTLDASGRLGVGNTGPNFKLDVLGGSGDGIRYYNNTNAIGAVLGANSTEGTIGTQTNHAVAFITNSAERARITSGGDLLVGTTTTTGKLSVSSSASSDVYYFENTNATPFGGYVKYTAASPNGTGNNFFSGADSTTTRITLRSNGGIANYQANDVNLSDRREKTNFAPAKDYLDTICAIPVQTFNYIDQSEDDPGLTLGVVAQDVQAVAPELVQESNWGTKDDPKMRLSIYQTDLQYALMKCIQELKAQNDDLRARVAQLEAK